VKRPSRSCRADRGIGGFSLIELLAATAIAGVVFATIATLLLAIVRGHARIKSGLDLLDQAQEAVYGRYPRRGILQEIWRASAARSLASDRIELQVDGLPLAYRIEGTDLVRDSGAATAVVLRNVSALTCAYYGLDGSGRIRAAADTAAVILIQARLDFLGGERTMPLSVAGRLRNRNP
jgi:hypothetical protein